MIHDEELLWELALNLSDVAVVAKNPDIWASARRGSDWDLVVGDADQALARIEAVLGSPVKMVKRSYVWALEFDPIKIDLLPTIVWRGIPLLDVTQVFEGAERTSASSPIPSARLAHQAILACIFPTLAHGDVKIRYADLWRHAWATDGRSLQEGMNRIFGRGDWSSLTLEDLHRMAPSLRRRAAGRSLRRAPLRTISGFITFALAEFRVRSRILARCT